MKTTSSISQDLIQEKWYLVDAKGRRIGVLASKVSELLQAKNDPKIRRYHDPKVKVVVINASKVDVTPKKGMTKFYSSYSGYPGGLRYRNLAELLKQDSVKPIQLAVKGMLPRTKMGRHMLANLKIYSGETHPHEAQKPEVIDITKLKI